MTKRRPNIIYIYADDLGRGMLSCYGQTFFQTPNIDRLAEEGVRFTNSYGCAYCAPARASLLTGYHDCHAGRWSYTQAGIYKDISTGKLTYAQVKEELNNTSFNELEDEIFLPHIAKQAGYVTGQIGKLEWGFATTPERLQQHGWDYHYGYYDHQRCHGFYPPFLFEDGELQEIAGNEFANCGVNPGQETAENAQKRWDFTGRKVYSQDLFNEKIDEFIRAHKDESFFLYHPSQLPHGPISVPEIHAGVEDVEGLTQFEKEYASMVLRLDDTVGLIFATLEECGILENTLIAFASDNGHENYYAEEGRCNKHADLAGRRFDNIDYNYTSERAGDVFDGNDGMSGKKLNSLEGGTRIPFIIRWPEIENPGRVSDHVLANYDFLPTMAEILKVAVPSRKDGVSFASELLGQPQEKHDCVVFAGIHGPAVVSHDGWKLRYITSRRFFQLFHLPDDYMEENNLADQHPEKVKELGRKLVMACDGNFYHGTSENHKAVRIEQYMAGQGPEDAFPQHIRWSQN